jgi:hypothetical protein
MHACMYVCMHACMHVCMHVCVCVCMYVCMHYNDTRDVHKDTRISKGRQLNQMYMRMSVRALAAPRTAWSCCRAVWGFRWGNPREQALARVTTMFGIKGVRAPVTSKTSSMFDAQCPVATGALLLATQIHTEGVQPRQKRWWGAEASGATQPHTRSSVLARKREEGDKRAWACRLWDREGTYKRALPRTIGLYNASWHVLRRMRKSTPLSHIGHSMALIAARRTGLCRVRQNSVLALYFLGSGHSIPSPFSIKETSCDLRTLRLAFARATWEKLDAFVLCDLWLCPPGEKRLGL